MQLTQRDASNLGFLALHKQHFQCRPEMAEELKERLTEDGKIVANALLSGISDSYTNGVVEALENWAVRNGRHK